MPAADIDFFPTIKDYYSVKEVIGGILKNIKDYPNNFRHRTEILSTLPIGNPNYMKNIPEPIYSFILNKKDWTMKKIVLKKYTGIPEVTLFFVYDVKDPEEPFKDEKILEKMLNIIKSWLYFLSDVKKLSTDKKLQFYFYMTPFKKEMPKKTGQPLSEININAGYYMVGTEYIYIYRREECVKLFLHEILHVFYPDYSEGMVEYVALMCYLMYGELMGPVKKSIIEKLSDECERGKRLWGLGDKKLKEYVGERVRRYRGWGVCEGLKERELERSLRGSAYKWRWEGGRECKKYTKRRRRVRRINETKRMCVLNGGDQGFPQNPHPLK